MRTRTRTRARTVVVVVAVARASGRQPLPPPPTHAHTTDANAADANADPSSAAAGGRTQRPCPSCGVGQQALKFSRFGAFIGCTEYPRCGWTTRPRDPAAAEVPEGVEPLPDKAQLGLLPPSSPIAVGSKYAGLEVSLRNGPVGWYVQLGGNVSLELQQQAPLPDVKALKVVEIRAELEKRGLDPKGKKVELVERLLAAEDLWPLVAHKRSSLPAGTAVATLTMAMAERLLSLPLDLGAHPQTSGRIQLRNGRFGPYVTLHAAPNDEEEGDDEQHEAPLAMCSLPKTVSFWDVGVTQAAELLDQKMRRDAKRQGTKKRAPAAPRKAATRKAAPRKATLSKATPKAVRAGRGKAKSEASAA